MIKLLRLYGMVTTVIYVFYKLYEFLDLGIAW